MAKILVTGGAGFIGSNFIRYWLKTHPNDHIINLDVLSYAGNPDAVKEFENNSRVRFVRGNICNPTLVHSLLKDRDAVFHFAAETHVDRSILDSQAFLKTNVLGTHNLLENARKNKVKKFIFISTDEVYGSVKKGVFTEESSLKPNSPYSASKAAADLLCRCYWVTYKMPVIVTRCCNNFGPYQFPEKVIPLFVTNLMQDKSVPVYGRGLNVREWLYVMDHCRALDWVYRKGRSGEIYNVGSGMEISNIELAKILLKYFAKPASFIEYVKDRPGHDFRYRLDSNKIMKLGWKPKYVFREALHETIRWYQENADWWKKIQNRSHFKKYIRKQYR